MRGRAGRADIDSPRDIVAGARGGFTNAAGKGARDGGRSNNRFDVSVTCKNISHCNVLTYFNNSIHHTVQYIKDRVAT